MPVIKEDGLGRSPTDPGWGAGVRTPRPFLSCCMNLAVTSQQTLTKHLLGPWQQHTAVASESQLAEGDARDAMARTLSCAE